MLTKVKQFLLIFVLLFSIALPTFGQISSARIRQIQRAMKVPVSGNLDDKTVAQMKKIQKEHNWQDKVAPDSRLLILLGLGPDYKRLLNPKTAWVADVRRTF